MDTLIALTGQADVVSAPPVLKLALPKARILIVDDHPANLLALEAILEVLHLELVRASSGAEALRLLMQHEVALILLDVQMAGMDGMETAKRIKRVERIRRIPIIFLTAFSHDATQIFQGYARGAVDYLQKPFDPEILRTKVQVFVELHVQAQQIKLQAAQLVEQMQMFEDERRGRAEAEARAQARADVLAVVSHDLRNPLSAITMAASSILKYLPEGDPATPLRKPAEIIRRSALRMDALINDLLDVSQLEAGRISLACREETVRDMVGQVLETFEPLATQNTQHLSFEDQTPDAKIPCDRDRVFQVFSNLVGNALKFTPAGGLIRIGSEQVGADIRFSVSNSGEGIPADMVPHLFERYWHVRQGNGRGVGLGLSIAKGLVEAHGGRIGVEAQEGGMTFFFTLPLQGVAPASE